MELLKLLDSDTDIVDSKLIHVWESILESDVIKNNLILQNVDPYLGSKYKGNLYGLLHNEYQIPNSAIYINMRINGYKSSLEYDGGLDLYLLDSDVLLNILNTINPSN